MLSQLNNYIFLFFVLFASIRTNVDDVFCVVNQTKCLIYNESWCCGDYQFCGYYRNNCVDFSTTTQFSPISSEFPSGLLTVLILIPFFLLTICMCTGLRSQQQHQERLHSPTTNSTHQPTSRILIRRSHNVNISSTINSIYEEPPPSYETAVAERTYAHV